MTIKSHFNRSTTTKTVSRVPVSFEISIWKSRLKETRLHYYYLFFKGVDCFILKKKHTHYITFHKTYSNKGDISWQLCVLSDCRLRVLPMCPDRLRLSSGLPSPVEAGLLVAHAGLAIRQPPCHITWDIAANRHHYVGHRGESAPLRTK